MEGLYLGKPENKLSYKETFKLLLDIELYIFFVSIFTVIILSICGILSGINIFTLCYLKLMIKLFTVLFFGISWLILTLCLILYPVNNR